MPITVCANLHYEAAHPCDLLLQIEGATDATQHCLDEKLTLPPNLETREVAGEDGIGLRRWMNVSGDFVCRYEATFEISRVAQRIEDLCADPVSSTPSQYTKYLMPSRYCHPEDFFDVLEKHYGQVSGGALIAAISHWIGRNFSYDSRASHSGTTAKQSYAACAGVCRDYAHVLIALARAAGIPARYVSAYAPDVDPQDFHAVTEVFLNGAWHLVDPTGMAQAHEIIRIGVGRDAADVSFMTSYGFMALKKQSVEVFRTAPTLPERH